MILIILVVTVFLLFLQTLTRPRRRRGWRKKVVPQIKSPTAHYAGFPVTKPDWVTRAALLLHERHPDWSHRQLAAAFNQQHFGATGMSIGRTWMRGLIKRQAYDVLHRQRNVKHRVPEARPCYHVWGIDTTCLTDASGTQHAVLGVVDHGSRLNIALRRMKCFNTWTLLGALFVAFGEHGVPLMLKLDNHPVHHARWCKKILRRAGVRLRFSQPASPWQNGRIERFFGTFKAHLLGYVVHDLPHLDNSLDNFRFWYNAARPHQHLGGCTPEQVWRGIDPYRQAPKQVLWFEAWNGRLRGSALRH